MFLNAVKMKNANKKKLELNTIYHLFLKELSSWGPAKLSRDVCRLIR
jgi:hypothetical protein